MRYAYLRNEHPMPMSLQMEKLMSIDYDSVYVETADMTDRSQLNRLLDQLSEGDVLIVPDIRVLTLSLKELSELVKILMKNDIRFISLADQIDSLTPISFFESFNFLLDIVKDYSSEESVNLGGAYREKELGRPRINEKKVKEIQFLYHKRGLTMRQIADKTDVALGTVYKYTTLYQETPK